MFVSELIGQLARRVYIGGDTPAKVEVCGRVYGIDPSADLHHGQEPDGQMIAVIPVNARELDPIDMVLPCPKCGTLHIDAPEPQHLLYRDGDHDAPQAIKDGNGQVVLGLCRKCGRVESELSEPCWDNPSHKSHLCHTCGCVWRPADVPTNGVAAVKTRGKADTYPPQ